MAPPLFSQLHAVRVPLGESIVAVAFAFLQHKMQSTYEEHFQGLVNNCNENVQRLPNPESVIVDYEIAVIQAVNSIIGEHVEIQGCFYHLTQSTWRRVQSLGLTEMYKNSEQFKHFCNMLDGLAFLPVGDLTAGMEFLNRIAMLEAAGLVDYFDSTYVNGAYLQLQRRPRPRFPPPVWNVNEATINGTPRTNNQCEAWNNKFVHLVGHNHPSVFKCIKFLKLEERTAAVSIAQHQGVLYNRPSQRVTWRPNWRREK